MNAGGAASGSAGLLSLQQCKTNKKNKTENSNKKIDNQYEKIPILKSDISSINSSAELIELQYGNNCCCIIL